MESLLTVRLVLLVFLAAVQCVYTNKPDKNEYQVEQFSGPDYTPFRGFNTSRVIRKSTGNPTDDGVNWNAVVDSLINIAKSQIILQENDVIPLPDINKEIKKKKGIFRLKVKFTGREGWLKSLSSLKRTGDASVGREGTALKLTVLLGFEDLTLGYDKLTIEVWKTRSTGSVKGKVGSNSVRVTVKFDIKDDECVTTLEEVKLIEFGDFDIDIKGLGALDWLTSQLIDWLTKKREGDIEASIERTLAKKITKALKDFHCDEYTTLLMLPL